MHGDDIGDVELVVGRFGKLLARPRVKGHVDLWQRDQFLGAWERQRTQHRGIDRAEHRGRGADAEGKHSNHRNGESGALTQAAYRVPNVLTEVVERSESPRVAARFLNQQRVSESATSGGRRVRVH